MRAIYIYINICIYILLLWHHNFAYKQWTMESKLPNATIYFVILYVWFYCVLAIIWMEISFLKFVFCLDAHHLPIGPEVYKDVISLKDTSMDLSTNTLNFIKKILWGGNKRHLLIRTTTTHQNSYSSCFRRLSCEVYLVSGYPGDYLAPRGARACAGIVVTTPMRSTDTRPPL